MKFPSRPRSNSASKIPLVLSALFVSVLSSQGAVSSFSLADLGGDGVLTGNLTLPNADAIGGRLGVLVTNTVEDDDNKNHSDRGTTGNGVQAPGSPDFGYIFGSGDEAQNAVGNNATTLTNYIRTRITFTQPVILNELIIRDIDWNSPTAPDSDFRDTVWGQAVSQAGADVGIDYFQVGSDLGVVTINGRDAYRQETGNLGNESPGVDATQLRLRTSEPISRIDLYIVNTGGTDVPQPTADPNHGVDLGTAISVTVIPEPSSLAFGSFAACLLMFSRRRKLA